MIEEDLKNMRSSFHFSKTLQIAPDSILPSYGTISPTLILNATRSKSEPLKLILGILPAV